MGWLPVLIASASAFFLYDSGHPVLFVLAILTAAGCFWSWGIMRNYAIKAARQRPAFRNDFFDITETEADTVPNWITLINMIFALAALVLVISAIVVAV